ncbi:sugar transferase [Croceibacterium salegens]|nr:sugar transferase [Croceibacterium salegens]
MLYSLSLVLDCLALVAGYLVARFVVPGGSVDPDSALLQLVALPIFLMLSIAREAQSVEALESRTIAVRRAIGALGGAAFALLAISFLLEIGDVSRLGFAASFAVASILIVLNKVLLDVLFCRWMNGSAKSSLLLLDGLPVEPERQMDVVNLNAIDLHLDLLNPEIMDALSRIIAPYDRVVVACRFEDRASWSIFLKGHEVGGEILLDRDLLQNAVAIGQHGAHDTLVLSRGPLSLASRIQKRSLDLIVGVTALLILAPLMILVAIVIKIESPGSALFRQVRVGQGNRQFTLLKFRSMRTDCADNNGTISVGRDDHRVTRIGKFIRRTSIDELPQLFNVLRGEMSIVGPRPHALGSLAGTNLFWEASENYWIRHALKPGITGLAQIRGYRGSTESVEDLKRRVRADLEYLAHWSMANDLLIMLRTIRVVIHKNAY